MAIHFDLISGDALIWTIAALTRAAVVFPRMPGANNAAAGKLSLPQRAALVKANSTESTNRSLVVTEGIHAVRKVDFQDGIQRQIGKSSHLNERHHLPFSRGSRENATGDAPPAAEEDATFTAG